MKTYNIKYEIHLTDGSIIGDKEMNVKKCIFAFEAQCKLEKFLKKKYQNFKRLIVHSCNEDVMSMFNDLFPGCNTAGGAPFGNMFG